MDKFIDRHLVINALLMTVWTRQPTETVLVHGDQGSQYGSADYLAFMKANNLEPQCAVEEIAMIMPWQEVSL